MLSGLQRDSLAEAGRLELLPDGWLREPAHDGRGPMVHRSGLAILALRGEGRILAGEGLLLPLASEADAMAAASALLGTS